MKRFLGVLCTLLLVFSLAAIGLPSPVQAATFTVNSTADATDANPGDGICDDGTGNCTLRAAIQEANALAGPDTINLPVGNYTLSIAGANENAAATGDLDITTDNLTIIGADQATTIIDGDELDRVFHIPSPWPISIAEITVEISDVTIRNGNAVDGGGINNNGRTVTLNRVAVTENTHGGIDNHGGLTLIDSNVNGNSWGISNTAAITLIGSSVNGNSIVGISNRSASAELINSTVSGNAGRGIVNGPGTLTLTDSTIANNTGAQGGGIFNWGTLTLTRSTVSGNTASENGGGIYHEFLHELTINNSTITGNVAGGDGGGIYHTANPGAPTTTVLNATITENSAVNGGGIYITAGDVELKNSIVANNPIGGDCGGIGITSLGHNLDSDGTCGLGGTGDLSNTNPLLAPLADNGGPTFTHALLAGSPAIDAGDNTGSPATDQRGIARPLDGDGDSTATVDMGAYEYVPPLPPPVEVGGEVYPVNKLAVLVPLIALAVAIMAGSTVAVRRRRARC